MKTIGVHTLNEQAFSEYISPLVREGYKIITQFEFEIENIDVVLIDYTTSNKNEELSNMYELVLNIRKKSSAFLFVLLDEASSLDRITYLQFGANVVIDRSTPPIELSLILKNLLRENEIDTHFYTEDKQKHDFKLYPNRLAVRLEGGQKITLTRLEYQLLSYLWSKGEEGSTYKELFSILWEGNEQFEIYRIANLVFNIRKKIERNPKQPSYLKTIRTIGYRLNI